ncbi:MAG: HEAT repeat domain-containing protein [Candidatus Micrarchaeota archaeon]
MDDLIQKLNTADQSKPEFSIYIEQAGETQSVKVLDTLLKILKTGNKKHLCAIARALAKIGIKEAVPELLEHLFLPDFYKRREIGQAIKDIVTRAKKIEDLGYIIDAVVTSIKNNRNHPFCQERDQEVQSVLHAINAKNEFLRQEKIVQTSNGHILKLKNPNGIQLGKKSAPKKLIC